MSENEKITVGVSLKENVKMQLQALADEDHRSLSAMIAWIIDKFLSEINHSDNKIVED